MYRSLYILLMAIVFVVPFIPATHAETVTEAASAVEAELGGRAGVFLAEPGKSALVEYRADERFPMSSTFKLLLCGAILSRVDLGQESLDRQVHYDNASLVEYSPVTELYTGSGMSVGNLCAAAITLSDNTAANLLLDTMGGPHKLTEYLRDIGDETTRIDRRETELNEGRPGDNRDTTTPEAMVNTLETLLFSDTLSPESREQLELWMRADQVADGLIRASLPPDWTIGDKTGAGGHGSRGIVAVIRTTEGDPWLIAIYLTGNEADMETRNKAIARIGAASIEAISGQ
jgi:beta-lactamase class A